MTYQVSRVSACNWIEYRTSSTQTISSGSIVLFDSKRTTGPDSVSVDSSTGVVSLSPLRRYWIQASIVIEKSSDADYRLDWESSTGTALTITDGNLTAYHEAVGGAGAYPYTNSSYVASLLVDYPAISYRLKVTSCPSNSTLLTSTHLFIMEMH